MPPPPPTTPRHAAPLIGIVTHELRAEAAPAWAPAPGRSERDLAPQRLALRLTYAQAVQEAGGLAVVLPAHGYADDPDALLDRVDGLLFTGGPDLDPAVYGRPRHPSARSRRRPHLRRVRDRAAGRRDRARPARARHLPRNAGAERLPRRHAPPAPPGHHGARPPPGARAVRASAPGRREPGSLLHELSDASALAVNSFHHQAADAIGAGLEVCAQAPDGTVEAIWDPTARFCLGVQWHAELLTHHARHAAVVEGLVAASRPVARRLALVA
jgi:putative glutamine amidotransferase